jgi:hypothetical protein
MSRLMITADGGGSNGSRLRLWKYALVERLRARMDNNVDKVLWWE